LPERFALLKDLSRPKAKHIRGGLPKPCTLNVPPLPLWVLLHKDWLSLHSRWPILMAAVW
jgi:hypothetical protein